MICAFDGLEEHVDQRYSEWIDFIVESQPYVNWAKDLAKHLHDGDKYGDEPYIYHLYGVARKTLELAPFLLEHADGDYQTLLTQALMVAFMHDSVEDGKITISDLRIHFGDMLSEFSSTLSIDVDAVIQAISNLTRRDDETYPQYILNKICNNGCHITKLVKIADLRFNKEHNLIAMRKGKKHFKHMYDKYSFAEFIVMQSVYTKI